MTHRLNTSWRSALSIIAVPLWATGWTLGAIGWGVSELGLIAQRAALNLVSLTPVTSRWGWQ
jgi:hypothetical protein